MTVPTPFRAPVRCANCFQPVQGATASPAYCDKPVCQTRARMAVAGAIGRKAADDAARIRTLGAQRVAGMLREAAARIGAGLEDVPHEIVPFHSRPLVPTPPETRAAFLAHLDAIIAEAFAAEEGELPTLKNHEVEDDDVYTRRTAEAQDEGRALDASCAACQGVCCMQGHDTHAFLTARSIHFVRHQMPDATAEEIRALYTDRMPERSILKSCVFHGPVGCTLPRTVRADICNYWQCRARESLRQKIAARGGSDRAIAVALDTAHLDHPEAAAPVTRTVTVTPDALAFHDDLRPDAVPSDA